MTTRKKGRPPKPWQDRFWGHVWYNPASGCFEWTARLLNSGYGTININGVHKLAHRVAWEDALGPIPSGFCVLHSCDNRKCVTVHHLFLGTHKDNARDMHAKGRARKPKITADVVSAVLFELSYGERQVDIAKRYGITQSTVSKIKLSQMAHVRKITGRSAQSQGS